MKSDLGPRAVAAAPRPRKTDQLESVIGSEIKAPVQFCQARKNGDALVAVYDGRAHIGFVYRGDSNSVEAFDAGGKNLGRFSTEAAAASAVWRHAHGQEPRK
jgi:hypothetical protein